MEVVMRVIEIPGHVPDVTDRISNDAVRDVLEDLGIEYLVTLPESLYEVLLQGVIKNSSMKIVQVCRESEGVSICSGLTYGGKKAALLCSFKGLYNSISHMAITANLHGAHDQGQEHGEKNRCNGDQCSPLISPDVSPGQF